MFLLSPDTLSCLPDAYSPAAATTTALVKGERKKKPENFRGRRTKACHSYSYNTHPLSQTICKSSSSPFSPSRSPACVYIDFSLPLSWRCAHARRSNSRRTHAALLPFRGSEESATSRRLFWSERARARVCVTQAAAKEKKEKKQRSRWMSSRELDGFEAIVVVRCDPVLGEDFGFVLAEKLGGLGQM